tara:strand:+ start:1121 stop:1639 length:519 start_codon:yes stop_codon:yes gene_type:complete
MVMSDKNKTILFSQKEIEEYSKKVAYTLDTRYEDIGHKLVLAPILQGAIPFFSEISKNMTLDCLVDTVGLKSYRGKVQGDFDVYKDFSLDLKGKHVWLIDDIADSGKTLQYLTRVVMDRGAYAVRTCTLLKRKGCPIELTMCGKEIDDEWCVGFGMDDEDGMGRTLNNIIAI